MESRRLVVWISAGILGFQRGTLVLDLIHCSALSWLYVRRHGLELVEPAVSVEQRPPEGLGRLEGLGGNTSEAQSLPQPQPVVAQAPAPNSTSQPRSPQPSPRAVPLDPTEVFCDRPRGRVDAAVGQGLSILAGLALGGSVGGGGKADAP